MITDIWGFCPRKNIHSLSIPGTLHPWGPLFLKFSNALIQMLYKYGWWGGDCRQAHPRFSALQSSGQTTFFMQPENSRSRLLAPASSSTMIALVGFTLCFSDECNPNIKGSKCMLWRNLLNWREGPKKSTIPFVSFTSVFTFPLLLCIVKIFKRYILKPNKYFPKSSLMECTTVIFVDVGIKLFKGLTPVWHCPLYPSVMKTSTTYQRANYTIPGFWNI